MEGLSFTTLLLSGKSSCLLKLGDGWNTEGSGFVVHGKAVL